MKQKSQTGLQIAETRVNNDLDAQLNKWLADKETDQVTANWATELLPDWR